ncbi:MAG: hypothetical protein H7138_20855 [Myxococcales bacterium]|nr:hypothetical protein [Myxococcales bacterium]
MTQWSMLKMKRVLECEIQNLFDAWDKRPDGRLFGVPDWLNEIRVAPIPPGEDRTRRSFGYAFTPDVEFIVGSHRYVIELKQGAKYEPLALAEVLHHAAWLKRYDSKNASQVVPVIVSQYNSWLRLAIEEYLRAVVRYVETIVLETTEIGNLRNAAFDKALLFAFDVPLAPWAFHSEPPSWLAALDPRAAHLRWHHVAENDSWFGLEQEMPTRPTFLEGRYVWVVRGGGPDRSVLLWEGYAAKRGEKWTKATSPGGDLDGTGRYFLASTSNGGRATDGPTWLAGIALSR